MVLVFPTAWRLQGRLDVESQCRGFLDLAKAATGKLVEGVFKEPPFLELFQKLYHTDDWLDGSVTSSVLATVNDYFQDYQSAIDAANFKRHAAHSASDHRTFPPLALSS